MTTGRVVTTIRPTTPTDCLRARGLPDPGRRPRQPVSRDAIRPAAGGRGGTNRDLLPDGGGVPYSAYHRFHQLMAEDRATLHDAALVDESFRWCLD